MNATSTELQIRSNLLPDLKFPTASRVLAKEYSEIEELCVLCSEGKLYAVEKWIASGKPIQLVMPKVSPPRKEVTPLQWAVMQGFHSLAELLLVNGYDPNSDYYESLSLTIQDKQSSMAELLIQHGADTSLVDFADVLETYDRQFMEVFVNGGVDPCAGNAVARALECGRRGRPLLGFIKSNMERFPQLQHQIDIGLNAFIEKEDAKGVALMIWLGANPYVETPMLPLIEGDDHKNCAIKQALMHGNQSIIKSLLRVPIPKERTQYFLQAAASNGHTGLTRKLLEMGANPNILDDEHHMLWSCVCSLVWSAGDNLRPGRRKGILESIRLLAEFGAKWTRDKKQLASLRRTLLQGEKSVIIGLLEIFSEFKVLSEEELTELTRTAAMKEFIASYTNDHAGPSSKWLGGIQGTQSTPKINQKAGYWKRHWAHR